MRTLLLFLLLAKGLFLSGQTVKINFSDIRNTSGFIRVQFYTSSQGFDDEKPLFMKLVPKTGVTNGQLSISFSGIKPGVYGIAVLDDENNNQKMDYGLLLPKEGFGFSDYYHTAMTRPKFDRFKFILGTETKTVEIKLRYL